jgi:hypothetical protein
MPEPEFIAPPADEPIPQPPPEGATDADLGGVIVDPADYTPEEAAIMAALTGAKRAAPAGTPTWAQTLALAMAQLAHTVKGREKENVNPLTRWYYGNGTVAAWCFIFISWVLAHAAKTASVGLAMIGGKKAYVPYIRNIKGYKAGHSGMANGAIVAISSFNHIGFRTSGSGSTFRLLSGNSTDGSSSDAVTLKTYNVSVVSGHVNLTYAPATPPKPIPSTAPSGSPVLKKGSTGSRVTQLQKAVNTTRTAKIGVDGEYGTQTEKAVSEFQSKHGLKVDGEYGDKTAAALKKVTG